MSSVKFELKKTQKNIWQKLRIIITFLFIGFSIFRRIMIKKGTEISQSITSAVCSGLFAVSYLLSTIGNIPKKDENGELKEGDSWKKFWVSLLGFIVYAGNSVLALTIQKSIPVIYIILGMSAINSFISVMDAKKKFEKEIQEAKEKAELEEKVREKKEVGDYVVSEQ